MNILIRGVRFSMRIGRANCVKDVLEPKADSTDPKDFFYLGDADPDRVRIKTHIHIAELLSHPYPKLTVQCSALQITDEEIKEFILEHCSAAFHPVSGFALL